MPTFSKNSLIRLSSAHPQLQQLFAEVIKRTDCIILCGYRGEADQNEACASGNSQHKWPTSKHNVLPALAVDAAPYPLDWKDIGRFFTFATTVKMVAKELEIKIRWGGDYATWKDWDHFELENEKSMV